MKDRAAAWLNEHFRGRGWDEQDRDALAAFVVDVAKELVLEKRRDWAGSTDAVDVCDEILAGLEKL